MYRDARSRAWWFESVVMVVAVVVTAALLSPVPASAVEPTELVASRPAAPAEGAPSEAAESEVTDPEGGPRVLVDEVVQDPAPPAVVSEASPAPEGPPVTPTNVHELSDDPDLVAAVNNNRYAQMRPAPGEDPVELEELRTETSRTSITSDGTFSTALGNGPMHVRGEDGSWVPIDTTLRDVGGGRFESTATPARVVVGATGESTVTSKTGNSVTASPVTASRARGVPAQVEGAAASYTGVWRGVDVELEVIPSGVKETLVLAGPGSVRSFEFRLGLDGLTARLTDGGEVELVDEKGEVDLVVPKGWMTDSAPDPETGGRHESMGVHYRLAERDGDTYLTIDLDHEWLDDPDRKWPVLVDPSWIYPGAMADDTHVNSCYTNNYSSLGYFKVGGAPCQRAGYAKWNLSLLPGAKIFQAELATWNSYSWSCSPRNVSVYRVTQAWDGSTMTGWPGATFDPNPVASRNVALGYNSSCPGNWVTFPITGLAQAWVNGELPNFGVTYRVNAGTTSDTYTYKEFATVEAYGLHTMNIEWSPYKPQWQLGSTLTQQVYANQAGYLPITISNIGPANWLKGGANPFRVAYHVYNADRTQQILWDGARTALPTDMPFMTTRSVSARINPLAPGSYRIEWDMVKEGETWFSQHWGPYASTTTGPMAAMNLTVPNRAPTAATATPGDGSIVDPDPTLSLSGVSNPDGWPSGAPLEGRFQMCPTPAQTGGCATSGWIDVAGGNVSWAADLDSGDGYWRYQLREDHTQGTTGSWSQWRQVTVDGPGAEVVDVTIDAGTPTVGDPTGPLVEVGDTGGAEHRGLLRFVEPTDGFSHVLVEEATLEMRLVSRSGTGASTVAVHEASAGWTGGADWQGRNWADDPWTTAGGDYNPTPAATASVDATGQTYAWDVTDTVQAWADRDRDDLGFVMVGDTHLMSFGSWENTTAEWRPQLRVRYRHRDGSNAGTPVTFQVGERASLGVNTGTGNLSYSATDVSISGTGMDLVVARTLNGPDRHRWSFQVTTTEAANGDVTYIAADGAPSVFRTDGAGGYITPPDIDATLTKVSAGVFDVEFHASGLTQRLETVGSDPAVAWLVTETDRNGNQITYDAVGGGQVDDITDTQGRVLNLDWDGDDLETISDWTNREWSYSYDDGALVSYTDPENHTTDYTHDPGEFTVTTPEGRTSVVAYDTEAPHRVASVVQVTNPGAGTGPTTEFAYSDPIGGPFETVVTDPRDNDTTYRADPQGRTTEVIDAANHTRSTSYTPTGKTSTRTDALSAVFSMSWDSNDNLTGVSAPASGAGQSGVSSSFSYTDPSHSYLPSSSTDGEGNCSSYRYDSAGNVTDLYSGITPGGTECDNQTSTTRWQRTYNGDGTLKEVIDPNNVTTSFGYDSDGNLTSIDHPAPKGDESFTYDSLSRVATHTDGRNMTTGYTYDDLDRIVRITYDGDTACSSASTCVEFVYDDDGNLTSRTDVTGTTTWAYDELHRPTAMSLPGGANACSSGGSAATYSWDAAGNLIEHCDSSGEVTYSYDARNLPTGMAHPGGSCGVSPSDCVTFGYDANGRRTSTVYPTSPAVTETVGFDPAGNLTSVTVADGTNTLVDVDYTYVDGTDDTVLRRSMIDQLAGITTSYSYDAHGRLDAATESGNSTNAWTYGYDPAGNRTSATVGGVQVTFGYNDANQLVSASNQTATPAYDGAGNQTVAPNGLEQDISPLGQVAEHTLGTDSWAHTYADLDSTQRVDTDGTAEHHTLLGHVASDDGSTTTAWHRDPAGRLISSDNGTDRRYYVTDALGSTIALIGSNGTVTDTYRYDPFGAELATTGTTPNPWRYATGHLDPSGLIKFGTRYYQPATGTFTQPDPLPGQPPYAYAGNNPTNYTDPTGYFIGPVVDLYDAATTLYDTISDADGDGIRDQLDNVAGTLAGVATTTVCAFGVGLAGVPSGGASTLAMGACATAGFGVGNAVSEYIGEG